MNVKQALAALALTGAVGLSVPAPAMANGAASTRNIIFGAAAAAAGTLLIINHNRKVHERYAEDARRQAALQQENNDAWAAYHQEQRAYQEEVTVNMELKRELSYQHAMIVQQRRRLASTSQGSANAAGHHGVMVAYGWGDL